MEAFADFVKNHFFFAVFMFAIMLAAVTLVIWRILLNFNAKTDLNAFLPRFQEVLHRDGPEGAIKFCKAQSGSEVIPQRLFVAGLENHRQGLGAMRRSMASSIELDILPRLNSLLPSMLAIAKVATMIGLLGTVISMVFTFQKLGAAEDKETAQKDASREIGLALFATALGLVTAIPVVFAHVMFKAWVNQYEVKLKSSAMKLLSLVQGVKTGAGSPQHSGDPPPAKPREPTYRRG